ncbi:hypothetical protein EJ063_11025 [Vibrio aquaticus]|uniref:Chitin-binding type-2 domain-containing protein n=1 Tax=Vibrio aquaticus TaxID=2496559 RepID=A0A432CV66_9VIBR|nr:hypothetical protein EJ063_11025 [Vibrio aquaticus]
MFSSPRSWGSIYFHRHFFSLPSNQRLIYPYYHGDNKALIIAASLLFTSGIAYADNHPHSGFCSERPDGTYADPESKTQFYVCLEGATYVQLCPAGTIYDESFNGCTWQ